jgi:hypothetical protein
LKDVKEVENELIAIQKEKRPDLTMRQLSKKERLQHLLSPKSILYF